MVRDLFMKNIHTKKKQTMKDNYILYKGTIYGTN